MASAFSSKNELDMSTADFRTYHCKDVISFRRTGDDFGGLSNMAPGFPILLHGHRIRTSEALYQACRFPHAPKIQQMIIAEASPMTAKMKSKPFREQTREDWDDVRVAVMKWCLRIKLLSNWEKFSFLLQATGERPIVEDSNKDDFWGALLNESGMFEGRNVLGRLLMELREKLRSEPTILKVVKPVPIPDFLLLGEPISLVSAEASRSAD